MEQVKYPGVVFDMNGRNLIVPSLSLLQAKENEDLLSRIVDKESLSDLVKAFLPVVGMAIRRNYPEITDEYLTENLDLIQFVELCRIVQFASGYKRVTSMGEATPTASTGSASSAD